MFRILYGAVLCALIGLAASFLSAFLPLGTVAIAIVLGILVGNSVNLGARFQPGITFSEKQLLAAAIALLGVNLDYLILSELGYRTIALIIATMGVAIGASLLLAKALRVSLPLALLLGIGSGVCGSSAIAATEGIVGADEEEVGLAVAVVNFLGAVGMFLLPFLGVTLLGFTDIQAGVLIGNTLQAVGQVTAAGFAIGEVAGQTATIVKMGRILMLTPLVLLLLALFPHNASSFSMATPEAVRPVRRQGIPLFIVGFILFSLAATAGLFSAAQIELLGTAGEYALIVAMAGIGLKITVNSMLRAGRAALLAGSIIFLLQIVLSSSVIYLLF